MNTRIIFLISLFSLLFTSCEGSIDHSNNQSNLHNSGKESLAPSSEHYVTPRGISSKMLDGFSIDLADAKVIGIKENSGTNQSRNRSIRNVGIPESQNYIVISTDTSFNTNNPVVDSNSLVLVTFTKTETETFSLETYGRENLIAFASEAEVEVIIDELVVDSTNTIKIPTKNGYTYIVCDQDGNQVSAWVTPGEGEYTFTDVIIETAKQYFLKAKSIEAYLYFEAKAGFTYAINYDNQTIATVFDGAENDLNNDSGKIKIGGLEHGKEYDVYYYKIEQGTKIEQSEIIGEIDKLYVVDHFTFISYVPLGMSQRSSSPMYDSDGILHYDKTDYYISDARQSFIMDNSTGKIYPITDIHIKKIEGGCLLIGSDNSSVYDFRINTNKEFEIYPILTNATITVRKVWKDRYGHVFIDNDKLNYIDETNHITYFVFERDNNNSSYYLYQQTTSGETIKFKFRGFIIGDIPQTPMYSYIEDAWVMLENGQYREITDQDRFTVLSDNALGIFFSEIRDGHIYTVGGAQTSFESYDVSLGGFDVSTKGWKQCYLEYSNRQSYYARYVADYGIIFLYEDNQLYSLTNVLENFEKNYIGSPFYSFNLLDSMNFEDVSIIGEDIAFDNGKFLRYTPFGNINYELFVIKGDQGLEIKFYEAGTYSEPQTIYYLQPLN